MFFSSNQGEKLAFFFCPCCKTNLRSETSATFFSWLSYPLREGKHGLEEPTHFLLPWKIKQMNLAAFWFITPPLIINKTAERLVPYCVKRVNKVCWFSVLGKALVPAPSWQALYVCCVGSSSAGGSIPSVNSDPPHTQTTFSERQVDRVHPHLLFPRGKVIARATANNDMAIRNYLRIIFNVHFVN